MSGRPWWDQKVIPRTFTCAKRPGKSCMYENCLIHRPYSAYVKAFDTCPHRENRR